MDKSAIRNPQAEIDEADAYEAERRLYRAVKVVAETPEGKTLLDWLCEMAEYGGTAFRADSHQTDFALGRQDIVNRVMHIVHTPMEALLERVEEEERQHVKTSFDLLTPAAARTRSEFNLFK